MKIPGVIIPTADDSKILLQNYNSSTERDGQTTALINQKFQSFSPAATASLNDKSGGPLMAKRAYANPDLNQSPATPFDMGSGFVNATGSLDLVLNIDTGHDDYMSYLCGINGSAPMVLNYTGQSCLSYNTTIAGSDLNLPSITISTLHGSRMMQRTVANIAGNETFTIKWSAPYRESITVTTTRFFIPGGQKQVIVTWFNVTMNSSTASFVRIGLSCCRSS